MRWPAGRLRATGMRSPRYWSATTSGSTASVRAFSATTKRAADLAQDVCVGLTGKLPSYRGESRFTTWLYRVVVNAARDRMRRDGAMRRNEQDFAEVDSMIKAGRAERENEAIRLRRVLGALGADLRATVILVIEEGLRHAEAAEVLGVSESTVSWRMYEVRNRLRTLLTGEGVLP